MEQTPGSFDRTQAMIALAASSGEAIAKDLEAQSRSQRITEEQRTRLEDDAFIQVLTRPLRTRMGSAARPNLYAAIDWEQVKVTAAIAMLGLFSYMAGRGLINHADRIKTTVPAIETPAQPTTSRPLITRTPDGKATIDLQKFLQTDPSQAPSVYIRP